MSHTLIIGGGIIGMACADALARRGHSVTVIDKGQPGHGCSYGNAGWLTPCFALPLPQPGMLIKSTKWLLDSQSPLYIKPRLSLDLLRWLTRFVVSMNQTHLHRSAESLIALSQFSLKAYRQLDAEFPGSFGFTQKGLLMVAHTESGLAAVRQEMELVAGHGIPGESLDVAAVHRREPALKKDSVLGGVYFPAEAHVEPLAAVNALTHRATKAGAEVFSGTEVFDFDVHNGRIESVNTTRGQLRADQVVLATGSWSAKIARKLSLRVPVLGGKGYAVVIEPLAPSPAVPIMFVEKKVAITPRANSLRLAGTLELVDGDESITTRRVNAIVRNARHILNVPETPRVLELWRGLRPCTPDGVPVIGRAPKIENLVIATGHQMLGLQTAPATGQLVADIICGAAPSFDLQPFRPSRFS